MGITYMSVGKNAKCWKIVENTREMRVAGWNQMYTLRVKLGLYPANVRICWL
jgi:hypothetical protein